MASELTHILVIDDEPGICLAVSLLLQDQFMVDTAMSAKDGLEQSMKPHDLILLDLRMPGVNQYELLEAIRIQVGQTPIVILSAMGDLRTHDEVLQHGAVALIEKPFSRQEILNTILKILPKGLKD